MPRWPGNFPAAPRKAIFSVPLDCLHGFSRRTLRFVALVAAILAGALAGQPAGAAQARELTAETLYRVLVGDIALQRGEPGLAARAFYEAARDAEDPALARRATEVALFARQRALALESARLWMRLDPGAERARQLAATLSESGAGSDLKLELER